VGRASRFVSLWAALIDGLSPALTGLICLSPFFFSYCGFFTIDLAIQLSVVTTLVTLFLLGEFLGRISKRNLFIQGLKLFIVGVVITLIFLTLRIAYY
jgi:predicted membrane protein (TIGR00267 family)